MAPHRCAGICWRGWPYHYITSSSHAPDRECEARHPYGGFLYPYQQHRPTYVPHVTDQCMEEKNTPISLTQSSRPMTGYNNNNHVVHPVRTVLDRLQRRWRSRTGLSDDKGPRNAQFWNRLRRLRRICDMDDDRIRQYCSTHREWQDLCKGTESPQQPILDQDHTHLQEAQQ